MPNLGTTELLIIAGVLVLLFGAAKLPKLARSLGESARIFKSETKGLHSDEEDPEYQDNPDYSQVKQLPEAKHRGARVDERYMNSEGDLNKAG